MVEQVTSLKNLRALIRNFASKGGTIGFVPTMGALHDGHLELVKCAKEKCDHVIVSIFVNPKQFAPHEDFAQYPRTLNRDCELLKSVGTDAVYVPDILEIYPEIFSTTISVGQITRVLEGEFRPLFFDGVSTIVGKLLLQVLPDRAFFGEKDFQQLQVIKRMVEDLSMPVVIEPVETVRDEFGLALSSRNAYLNEDQLKIARELNVILGEMISDALRHNDVMKAENDAHIALLRAGFSKIDYCTIRHTDTLKIVEKIDPQQSYRALAAVWCDTTRLIDNKPVIKV